jgi:hypothetical protein
MYPGMLYNETGTDRVCKRNCAVSYNGNIRPGKGKVMKWSPIRGDVVHKNMRGETSVKDRNGQRIQLFRCECCGYPVRSVRAAENIEQYGCPVCGKKVLETVTSIEEAALVIPAYEVSQMQAHLERRAAR